MKDTIWRIRNIHNPEQFSTGGDNPKWQDPEAAKIYMKKKDANLHLKRILDKTKNPHDHHHFDLRAYLQNAELVEYDLSVAAIEKKSLRWVCRHCKVSATISFPTSASEAEIKKLMKRSHTEHSPICDGAFGSEALNLWAVEELPEKEKELPHVPFTQDPLDTL